MQPAGANLRNEIEERIGTNRQDWWHSEAEDQYGQQQNAAANSGHPDQSANYKADENLKCKIHKTSYRLTA